MANDTPAKTDTKSEGFLAATARVLGGAAGAVASTVGIHGSSPASATSSPRVVDGKYRKQTSHRMPRKLKKEMKKKETAAQSVA